MPALTKKRHTDGDTVTLNLHVQKKNVARIKAFVKDLEGDGERNYTVDEVFSDLMTNEQGATLRGYRNRENLTQRQLAELTGIPQRHISEMENGKRSIGKENAKKIGQALNVDYRFLL
jgi:DNA-binding XRE family transcriptional regulator